MNVCVCAGGSFNLNPYIYIKYYYFIKKVYLSVFDQLRKEGQILYQGKIYVTLNKHNFNKFPKFILNNNFSYKKKKRNCDTYSLPKT